MKLREQTLEVGFRSQEPTFQSHQLGFVEGLWRHDCGELFLFQPSTGRYLEINLAPNGAWWSCAFSGVRTRDVQIDPPQLENIESKPADVGWSAGFSLPLSEVERCLGDSTNLKANVTLILGGCPDISPSLENLHSLATLSAVDFHRPDEWLQLEELLD